MNFQKDFDTLFQNILTDWQNQFPEADLSEGSLIRMKSACLASALWGLYKHQDWIARQIFPDTSDVVNMEHHAWVYGISRKSGETDAALLARLLERIRRPPSGGNKYDYQNWALEVDNVAKAWCISTPSSVPGAVDVVIMANKDVTGSEIPSSSARIGVTTSTGANKLIDSAATFSTPHAVAVGDIVENPLRELRTTVTNVDSTTTLTLASDIFKYTGEWYIVHCQTGTNNTVTENKLIDSAGIFTNTTYTVKPGDTVENVTDATEAKVVTVDSATQLTLDADIFTDTGKTYVIRGTVADVKKHIDRLRPVTASRVKIVAPTIIAQTVTITVTGTNIDKSAISDSIKAYMNNMIPGQVLYVSRIIQLVMDEGADNVTVTTPATNVTPTAYQMIRPGTITVN